MATVDHSMTLNAPAAAVFDYLTDPEKATVWQSSLVEVSLTPDGPMQQGTRIAEVRKFLGRRIESTVEVTKLEPQRLFVGRVVAGPLQWEFRYTLEEAGGTTRVHVHLEGEPGGFFRLAEPLVIKAMKKQLERDLATLKEIVERE